MKPASLLMLSEGWPTNIRLALDLCQHGHNVTFLVQDPEHIHALLKSNIRTVCVNATHEIVPAIERLLAGETFNYIWPMSEPLLSQCWEREASLPGKLLTQVLPAHRHLYTSKTAMVDFARQCGIRVPLQFEIGSPVDALAAAQKLGFPLVVKGIRGSGGGAVHIVLDEEQLLQAVETERKKDNSPVVQQFLTGKTYLVGGTFHSGIACQLTGWLRTEQNNPPCGPSIVLSSARRQDLLGAAERLFGALRFTGIAEAEFVEQAGELYFIEVNPRPSGSLYSTAALGLDVSLPISNIMKGIPTERHGRTYTDGLRTAGFPSFLGSRINAGASLLMIFEFLAKGGWRQLPTRHPRLLIWQLKHLWWKYRSLHAKRPGQAGA